MLYDFHVHDVVRVEYRVTTDGPAFPRGYSQIMAEKRTPGGNGAVAAVALARWGAKVLLTGNPLGDDAHGVFLRDQLAQVEGLTYQSEIQAGFATPYAILVQAGQYEAGAMLSPTAGPMLLPTRRRDSKIARYCIGDHTAFRGNDDAEFDDMEIEIEMSGDMVRLPAASQDYQSLIGTLSTVAAVYLQLVGKTWPDEIKTAFTSKVIELYTSRFSDPQPIPTLEEIEAKLAASL